MPRVERIEVDYAYPEYTGLKNKTISDRGDVIAPQGTRITWHVVFNKAVAKAAVHFGDGRGTFREDMPTTGVFLDTGGKDVYRDDLDHPKAKEDGIRCPARDDHRWIFREETKYGFGLDVNLYQ